MILVNDYPDQALVVVALRDAFVERLEGLGLFIDLMVQSFSQKHSQGKAFVDGWRVMSRLQTGRETNQPISRYEVFYTGVTLCQMRIFSQRPNFLNCHTDLPVSPRRLFTDFYLQRPDVVDQVLGWFVTECLDSGGFDYGQH